MMKRFCRHCLQNCTKFQFINLFYIEKTTQGDTNI